MKAIIDGPHVDDDVLELYALGRLPDQRLVTKTEEHLLVCAYCRRSLDHIAAFSTAVRLALGKE